MLFSKARFFQRTLLFSVCVILCLLSLGDTPQASASIVQPKVPRLSVPTGKSWYQDRWLDTKTGYKAANQCVAAMKSNGLMSAIQQTWTGDPVDVYYGMAIACHEGDGQVGAVERGKYSSGGRCSFQATPTAGFPAVAKKMGIPVGSFVSTISSNPTACAKAGLTILQGLVQQYHNVVGGMCNYFGGAHARQYLRISDCAVRYEVLLAREYIIAILEGRAPNITAAVQDDPTKECYGCMTLTGDDDVGTIHVLNCHDYSMSLAADLAKAAKNFQNALRIGTNDFTQKELEAQASNPVIEGRGSIRKKFCIDDIMTYFRSLQDVLSGDIVGAIVSVIVAMLDDILNQACQLVRQAVKNLLTMVCLPLPNLSLQYRLPGLSGVSCGGVSLADYVKVANGSSASSLISQTGTQIMQPDAPRSLGAMTPYIMDNLVRSKEGTSVRDYLQK